MLYLPIHFKEILAKFYNLNQKAVKNDFPHLKYEDLISDSSLFVNVKSHADSHSLQSYINILYQQFDDTQLRNFDDILLVGRVMEEKQSDHMTYIANYIRQVFLQARDIHYIIKMGWFFLTEKQEPTTKSAFVRLDSRKEF